MYKTSTINRCKHRICNLKGSVYSTATRTVTPDIPVLPVPVSASLCVSVSDP